MKHIVKIFGCSGGTLEAQVMDFMQEWADNNLGHLHIFGVSTLDIEKIGGVDTQVWVTFEVAPASDFELALLEGSR